ncbi:hypothetical protein gvb01_00425 [Gardnerella vaginalis]|nr:hypothetical protein gvb01_00425 [Gardnerella vaginalis]
MAYISTTIPKELVYQDYPLFVVLISVSNKKMREGMSCHYVGYAKLGRDSRFFAADEAFRSRVTARERLRLH